MCGDGIPAADSLHHGVQEAENAGQLQGAAPDVLFPSYICYLLKISQPGYPALYEPLRGCFRSKQQHNLKLVAHTPFSICDHQNSLLTLLNAFWGEGVKKPSPSKAPVLKADMPCHELWKMVCFS